MVQIEYWEGAELLARLIAIHDPSLGTLEQLQDPVFFYRLLNKKGMGTRAVWYKIATSAFEENPEGSVIGIKKETKNGKKVRTEVRAPKNSSLLYKFSSELKCRKPLLYTHENIDDLERAANFTVARKEFSRWIPKKGTKQFIGSTWDLFTLYNDENNLTRVSKHVLKLDAFGRASMYPSTIEQTKNLNPSFSPFSTKSNFFGFYEIDQENEDFIDIAMKSENLDKKSISIRLNVGRGLPVFSFGRFHLTNPEFRGKCSILRIYPSNDPEVYQFHQSMKQIYYAENRIFEALNSLNVFRMPSPPARFDQI